MKSGVLRRADSLGERTLSAKLYTRASTVHTCARVNSLRFIGDELIPRLIRLFVCLCLLG